MSNTMTHSISPYQMRQLAENLRCFDMDSAFRQIELHLANGTINEKDAATIRTIVADRREWLF